MKLITDAVKQNASVDSTFFRRFAQDGGYSSEKKWWVLIVKDE